MKEKHRRVILEAMPLIIHDLIVDPSFLTQFEAKNIFIDNTIETIMVRLSRHVQPRFIHFCQFTLELSFRWISPALLLAMQAPYSKITALSKWLKDRVQV